MDLKLTTEPYIDHAKKLLVTADLQVSYIDHLANNNAFDMEHIQIREPLLLFMILMRWFCYNYLISKYFPHK